MNTIKSAAEFYRRANNKQVIKRVTGCNTYEDWPEIVEKFKQEILTAGFTEQDLQDKFVVTDRKATFRTHFRLRSMFLKEEIGTFVVRSADYYFVPQGTTRQIYGDKKGAKIQDNKLVKNIPAGGQITFEIIDN